MGVFDDLVFDEGQFDVQAAFGYPMDTIIEISKTVDCDYASVLSSEELALVNYDVTITADKIDYQMMVTLILDENSAALNESVIETILWSYATELENVNTVLQTAALRKDLSNVAGPDLDEHWGQILDVKRRTLESDGDYKRRLMTRIAVLTSSGTEPACVAIIESILNTPDVVDLISYWPAEVLVKWRSVEAMKLAEARWDAIEGALDSMLPAGVTWNTYFSYVEYRMAAYMGGRGILEHECDTLIEYPGRLAHHRMQTSLLLTAIVTQDYDVLSEGTNFKSYVMGMTRPWATRTVVEDYDILVEWCKIVSHDLDLITHKIYYVTQDYDLIDEKTILIEQGFDEIAEKNFKRRYSMDVTLA